MIVSYLLDQGAKIDKNVIALASNGSSEAVWQAFLDHGWDINSKCSTDAPVLKYGIVITLFALSCLI